MPSVLLSRAASSEEIAAEAAAVTEEALAKVDEIIAYCNSHPGTGGRNRDGSKVQAQQIRIIMTTQGFKESWDRGSREYAIQDINGVISYLE